MPDGSLVIIDEAQGVFPPRSSASTPPAHVAWLNVHRHKGFDIWLTTQHPKLIDGSVRALVGRHQHYRRLFGGQRACCYEWDSCSDSLSGMNNAVKSFFPYPKDIFKFYKSAEVHTKQNFKLPLWVWIPVIGLLMGLYFAPKAYSVLFPSKPVSMPPVSSAPASPAPQKILTPEEIKQAQNKLISACVATANYCQCYNSIGIKLVLSDSECRSSAHATNENFLVAHALNGY